MRRGIAQEEEDVERERGLKENKHPAKHVIGCLWSMKDTDTNRHKQTHPHTDTGTDTHTHTHRHTLDGHFPTFESAAMRKTTTSSARGPRPAYRRARR